MSTQFGDSRLPERFWSRVAPEPLTGCWLWTGSGNGHGYGQMWWRGRLRQTHRVVYDELAGGIPFGLHVDHVRARGCASTWCCNPDHLEPVTPRENGMRGDTIQGRYAGRTHCKHGHSFAEYGFTGNGFTGRRCRRCHEIRRGRLTWGSP